MLLRWILMSLFVRFLRAQENPEVIYAQVGGTVILPRYKIEGTEDNLYVNWNRENEETISRNPQSGIQKAKEIKTHADLTSDFSLKISPVQDSDFKTWSCEQHVLMKNVKKTYKLYHVTIPNLQPVMVGGIFSLQCNVVSSPLKPKVTWITPENSCDYKRYDSKSVTISDVSTCHSGVWTCKLEYGDRRTTEATTNVSVIDLFPSPDTIYTSSLSPSSTVNIPCSLYSYIPWSVLNKTGLTGGSWSFTPLSEPKSTRSLLSLSVGTVVRWDIADRTGRGPTVKERELKDHDLSIRDLHVSEKIKGDYTCSLKFNSKTLSRKVKVEVLKLSSSKGSLVYEGQGVNLTCTLGHQHSSDLEVKWNCSSCSFLSGLKPPHPSSLYIPEVKLKDRGKWTCKLWKNGTKLTSAVLVLKIEKAPVDIWLCVAITGGILGFILLLVIIIIFIRRHRQAMMYRRRKTKFCCCKNPQQNQKGFYKT
ncbi:CD4-1 molecule [Puntigrus tetrazona]|uniref:CD4-1 molecule n=1 Tax=Puntigrus tetrazona TaxID=1606681 RepID=UPI001C88E74E|nr:CD4-1 molecule [Puntigrus tetrazona]